MGMRAYAAHATNIATGTTLGILQVKGTASVRGFIYDLVIGCDANSAPADVAITFAVNRCTAIGASPTATPTPLPLDNDMPAASCVAESGTWGTPPTFGTVHALCFGLNQRATFRWVAAPGGELMTAKATTSSIIIESLAASTGTPKVSCSMQWYE